MALFPYLDFPMLSLCPDGILVANPLITYFELQRSVGNTFVSTELNTSFVIREIVIVQSSSMTRALLKLLCAFLLNRSLFVRFLVLTQRLLLIFPRRPNNRSFNDLSDLKSDILALVSLLKPKCISPCLLAPKIIPGRVRLLRE